MKVKLIGQNNYKENLIRTFFKNRGIDNYLDFLNLDKYNPIHPYEFDNMERAVNLILSKEGGTICAIADSDIDGISSVSILHNYIETYLDYKVFLSVHRKKTHGIDLEELKMDVELHEIDILLVPDAGSNDYEQHKILKEEYGIDVIVLDHHVTDRESEDAIVVNNKLSNKSVNLTGSAMAYKFIQAIGEEINEPYEDDYLDLAILGLVGDMADTRDLEVQYLIRKGIKEVTNPFLATIAKLHYGINENNMTQSVIGYSVAPIINACTRVADYEDMLLIVEAFCNKNIRNFEYEPKRGKNKGNIIVENLYEHAYRIATSYKKKQDAEIDKIFFGSKRPPREGLNSQIEKRDVVEKGFKVVLVDATEFNGNKGLSGLIANKIQSYYNIPALVVFKKDSGYYGSGRGNQIPFFRKKLSESGLLKFAEGHEPAFGIGADSNIDLEQLQEQLNSYFEKEDLEAEVLVDFILNKDDLTNQLKAEFEQISDYFGTGIKPPLLYIENIQVKVSDISTGSKDNMLKFSLSGTDFVKFKISEVLMEKYLPWKEHVCYNIICKPNMNSFNGSSNIQMIIEEIEVVEDFELEERNDNEDEFTW